MINAQLETYGDGLDRDALHPYMWAAKPHYYNTALSYYNFPYMFGMLFGLGLYARYQQDPADFKSRYDDLLASTGLANAASLANGMGIDTHAIDFWRSSLETVKLEIDHFEILAGKLTVL
jgi:oligoendopeptidase F